MSVELLLDGECTSTRNAGSLLFHAGPTSTKCLSVSAAIPSTLWREPASSLMLCSDVSLLCAGIGGAGSFSVPCKTHASAPLVTKLEKRFKDRPPRRLRRKLGNHSPVDCGTMGRGCDPLDGEPRGVIEEPDASRLLRVRTCVVGNEKPGKSVKSAVNYSLYR